MSTKGDVQGSLWQLNPAHLQHVELCNAFYAREVLRLSQESDPERLKKLLKSLPFYVEAAARNILEGNSPLQLDEQNGSWIAKQRLRAPDAKQSESENHDYYERTAKVGLIVPIMITQTAKVEIRLDSVDEIDHRRLHCNEHGWFDFNGCSTETLHLFMLKPTKAHMQAACCGHTWNQHKKAQPRRLSLREMLLAARINWKNFSKPLLPRRI